VLQELFAADNLGFVEPGPYLRGQPSSRPVSFGGMVGHLDSLGQRRPRGLRRGPESAFKCLFSNERV
jgi:hypothetical protein